MRERGGGKQKEAKWLKKLLLFSYLLDSPQRVGLLRRAVARRRDGRVRRQEKHPVPLLLLVRRDLGCWIFFFFFFNDEEREKREVEGESKETTKRVRSMPFFPSKKNKPVSGCASSEGTSASAAAAETRHAALTTIAIRSKKSVFERRRRAIVVLPLKNGLAKKKEKFV